MKTMTAAALAGLFVASAAFAEEPAKTPDLRIGKEVDRICFARNIDGWKTPKGVDDAVLLETGVNNWYLVRTTGACRARDFHFAQTIGIESRPGGGCVSRGDVILVQGAGDFVNRCFITQINEWDDKAPAPEAEKKQD